MPAADHAGNGIALGRQVEIGGPAEVGRGSVLDDPGDEWCAPATWRATLFTLQRSDHGTLPPFAR